MRILDLALKDLSQMLRDKRSLLFLVVMPIAFTFFMGFAYRGSTNANTDHRIPLAIVNPETDAVLNKMLLARLDLSQDIHITNMTETDAMEALHKGNVAGVLIIPTAFSEQALTGKDVQLKLIADPLSAQGQSLYQLLRVPISQLMSAVETSRETAEIARPSDPPAEQQAAFELAWGKWDVNARLLLVKVELAITNSKDWSGGNPYNQASPGILVQFAIFGLVTSAQILVQERKSRTLQRLITTAMRPWEIVAGHMLAMFAIVFLQTVMLVLFGQWVLKVNYLHEPLGTFLVAVALGLWVASMGLLIGVLANEEQQVVLYSLMAMFLFSALGGTWFPLESSGSTFATIGKLMPSAWAMNGFQNILIRGLGLESIGMSVAMLMVYAGLFFVLAVWRFRKIEM